jgi:hypothetical protein
LIISALLLDPPGLLIRREIGSLLLCRSRKISGATLDTRSSFISPKMLTERSGLILKLGCGLFTDNAWPGECFSPVCEKRLFRQGGFRTAFA